MKNSQNIMAGNVYLQPHYQNFSNGDGDAAVSTTAATSPAAKKKGLQGLMDFFDKNKDTIASVSDTITKNVANLKKNKSKSGGATSGDKDYTIGLPQDDKKGSGKFFGMQPLTLGIIAFAMVGLSVGAYFMFVKKK